MKCEAERCRIVVDEMQGEGGSGEASQRQACCAVAQVTSEPGIAKL